MLRKTNKYVKLYFKRLLCKHDYKPIGNYLVNCGMNKVFKLKCKNCNKTKVIII